ncbi:MAG: DUF4349 domain-containing protein [Planctomycetes bacterium]|nr:DUF4349 domain-containing protein [Planctomycetota bacterium]
MRWRLGLLLSASFLMLVSGCASSPGSVAASRPQAGIAATLDDVTAAYEPAAQPLAGAFYADGADGDLKARREARFEREQPRQDRMLIHTGEIAIEVARPEESIARFLEQVAGWQGYLQSRVDTRVTVRLPATRFDAAFEALRQTGRVLREARRANDVTEEYLDLEIRLDNASKSRDRLLALLERADKVEDILAIEKELRRLTDEIETMEGRRKYLADQVALATVTAEFRAVSEPPPDRRRRPSRFDWVNRVGAERVMGDF